MKKWGNNNKIIMAKADLSLEEAQELLSKVAVPLSVRVNITVSLDDTCSWEKMLELGGVKTISIRTKTISIRTKDDDYVLCFDSKTYFMNDNAFYMTDTEARAVYICLVYGAVIDGFVNISGNFKRRCKKIKLFDELSKDCIDSIKME